MDFVHFFSTISECMMRGALVGGLLALFVGVCLCLEYPEREWEQVGRSGEEEELSFTLSLQMEHLDVLDDLAARLTTPGSPEFRQWKTMEQLNEITKPDVERTQQLLQWLSRSNLAAESFGDFVKVSGAVSDIESAFLTEFFTYRNILRRGAPTIHRSIVHPTIPVEFRGFVLFITGISNFPYPSKPLYKRNAAAKGVDSYYIVPQTLRNQYSVPPTTVATNVQSSQGVVEFGTVAGVSIPDLQASRVLGRCERRHSLTWMGTKQQFMKLTGGDTSANLTYTVGNFKFISADPGPIDLGKGNGDSDGRLLTPWVLLASREHFGCSVHHGDGSWSCHFFLCC